MSHSSPLNSCSKLVFFPEALQTDKIKTVQTSEISLCVTAAYGVIVSQDRGEGKATEQFIKSPTRDFDLRLEITENNSESLILSQIVFT